MKRFVFTMIITILWLTSCNDKHVDKKLSIKQESSHSAILPGVFVHSVYFWLNEPDNEIKNTAFEKNLIKFLEECKHIKTYHLGRPADTNRSIIDTSYTYALIVTFDSKVEHDLYQEDPLHKNFVKESAPLWNRIQIYDSLMGKI